MRNMSYHKKIEERISSLPDGAVFVTSDFSDIANPDTASKTLLRMADNGLIHRIIRGIYSRVDKKNKGCDVVPGVDEVARAIARSNSWKAVPCGDTSLYLSGLKADAPEVWTYVTDGTYREYSYNNTIIRFQHTSGKLLYLISDRTALIVQVIKTYGQDMMNEELLKKIHSRLCSGNEEKLLHETRYLTDWISKAIRKMCDYKKSRSIDGKRI